MLDILLDTVIDSLKLIPFLFITYLIMEYLEHKLSDKSKEKIKKSGKIRTFNSEVYLVYFHNVDFQLQLQIFMQQE